MLLCGMKTIRYFSALWIMTAALAFAYPPPDCDPGSGHYEPSGFVWTPWGSIPTSWEYVVDSYGNCGLAT